jgi:hypothetical protein
MLRVSRSTILIFVSVAIMAFAVACDSAAEKPTAEPPTAVPTAASQSTGGGAAQGSTNLADANVRECLAEQLGEDFDPELGRNARGLFGTSDPEAFRDALEACGIEPGITREDARRPGGITAGGLADPEVQECLNEELGEEFFGRLGQGSGIGLTPDSIAALEKCGVDLPDPSGGFRFGGGPGGFGQDDGIFGRRFRDGQAELVEGGAFQECLAEALGDDALDLLGNPTGVLSPELREAFEQCGGAIGIPVEPGSGTGDGADPILVEPEVDPTATPVPVSDLTIEQLTCLSEELDPAALASAVVATSAGDLSQVSDEVLAALQSCDVGT